MPPPASPSGLRSAWSFSHERTFTPGPPSPPRRSQSYKAGHSHSSFNIGSLRSFLPAAENRYQRGGFDLNLTYITSRIIVLKEPVADSHNVRGLSFFPKFLQDRKEDVTAFLENSHRDRYHIFKLCPPAEVSKHFDIFDDDVSVFPVEESAPPSLEMIMAFCSQMAEWLCNSSNVAVVQCPDGVSTSGIMICCFLLSQGLFKSPDRAIEHFRRMRLRRSGDDAFDRNPSFSRYISYFFASVRGPSENFPRINAPPHPVRIVRAQISGVVDAPDAAMAIWPRTDNVFSNNGPNKRMLLLASPGSLAAQPFYSNGAWLRTKTYSTELTVELIPCRSFMVDNGGAVVLCPTSPIEVNGDVKIQVFSGAFGLSKQVFGAWFNTTHVASSDGVYLPTDELDTARKPTGGRLPSLDLVFDQSERC